MNIYKEIELLIKLKYGDPVHTKEYLDRLPDAVIRTAFIHLINRAWQPKLYHQRLILGINLQKPMFEQRRAKEAIHKALVEYHLLLG